MPTTEGFQGVSNCYVFKSRLQEYAQKVGLATPVYETIKEGPSHEPSFRSTVILNDVRYDSLPGFCNRKAAEQSAAEVALVELAKSGDVNQCISQPIHETGLCKNLLQEYAQKMSYAIPLYQCQREESPGRSPLYSCTVEIGGIRYVGAAAKTKKEAEIKVARTAVLAIWSSNLESSTEIVGNSQLTVLPTKKRGTESNTNSKETTHVPKPKKARFKKRLSKKKHSGDKVGQTQFKDVSNLQVYMDGPEISGSETHAPVKPMTVEGMLNSQNVIQSENEMSACERGVIPHVVKPMAVEGMPNSQNIIRSENEMSACERGVVPHAVKPMAVEGMPNSQNVIQSENEMSACERGVAPHVNNVNAENGRSTASFFTHSDNRTLDAEAFSLADGNTTPLANEVNMVSGVGEAVSLVHNSAIPYLEASSVMPGLDQSL